MYRISSVYLRGIFNCPVIRFHLLRSASLHPHFILLGVFYFLPSSEVLSFSFVSEFSRLVSVYCFIISQSQHVWSDLQHWGTWYERLIAIFLHACDYLRCYMIACFSVALSVTAVSVGDSHLSKCKATQRSYAAHIFELAAAFVFFFLKKKARRVQFVLVASRFTRNAILSDSFSTTTREHPVTCMVQYVCILTCVFYFDSFFRSFLPRPISPSQNSTTAPTTIDSSVVRFILK